jgi:hypothetical protein
MQICFSETKSHPSILPLSSETPIAVYQTRPNLWPHKGIMHHDNACLQNVLLLVKQPSAKNKYHFEISTVLI